MDAPIWERWTCRLDILPAMTFAESVLSTRWAAGFLRRFDCESYPACEVFSYQSNIFSRLWRYEEFDACKLDEISPVSPCAVQVKGPKPSGLYRSAARGSCSQDVSCVMSRPGRDRGDSEALVRAGREPPVPSLVCWDGGRRTADGRRRTRPQAWHTGSGV